MDLLQVLYFDDYLCRVDKDAAVRVEYRCEDILILAMESLPACGDEAQGYSCCGWQWDATESDFFDIRKDQWLQELSGNFGDLENEKVVRILREYSSLDFVLLTSSARSL